MPDFLCVAKIQQTPSSPMVDVWQWVNACSEEHAQEKLRESFANTHPLYLEVWAQLDMFRSKV